MAPLAASWEAATTIKTTIFPTTSMTISKWLSRKRISRSQTQSATHLHSATTRKVQTSTKLRKLCSSNKRKNLNKATLKTITCWTGEEITQTVLTVSMFTVIKGRMSLWKPSTKIKHSIHASLPWRRWISGSPSKELRSNSIISNRKWARMTLTMPCIWTDCCTIREGRRRVCWRTSSLCNKIAHRMVAEISRVPIRLRARPSTSP